ncbi:nischarin isoform 2-T2 [Rhinophrynus dorsalis]
MPTCVTGDAKTDLGHILDFMCRLKYLKITGTRGMVGTSNIEEQKLSYDLSVFKSLCQIEVSHCSAEYITGLTSCKDTLETMSIQFSASSMKDILVPEANEFDQWEPEGTSAECPITAVIPKWKMLTTLDMSHNSITCIDNSVKLIPQIEYLDLSHNDISSVDNLQHLYNLIHLDLSYNKIWDLSTSYTKVGNIKTLNLAGNLLQNLSGLNKLYSLVNLDLSNNKIEQLEEINNIGKLPCLENVNLTNNPVTIIPDYRTKVLAQFGDRASEVCLDTMLTTRKELDTVEVLKAIQKSKEAKLALNMSDKTVSVESRLAAGSAKTICSSLPANVSSTSKSRPVNAKQVLRDAGLARLSSSRCWTPGSYGITPRSGTIQNSALEGKGQLHPRISQIGAVIQDDTSENNGDNFPLVLPTVHNTSCSCISYCDSDLIGHFSTSIVQMLNQPPDLSGEKSDSKGNLGSSEPGDGYFEMGLKEENQSDGNATDPLRSNLETVTITQFLFSFSIHFSGVLAPMQFVSCFVLTDTSVALFEIPFKAAEPSHQPPPSLKLVLCFSYDDLTELAFIIPEMCLSLKVRNGEDYLFVLSDSQKLGEFYGCLRSRCSQSSSPDCSSLQHEENMSLHSFLLYLCRVLQVSGETGEIQGCFPVCLFHSDEKNGTTQQDFVIEKGVWTSPCAAVYSSIRSALEGDKTPLPSLLFLVKQHMILMKIDFSVIPGKSPKSGCTTNVFHLSKVPLACVLLHPVLNPDGHRVQLIMDCRSVTMFFVFPHDKLRFITGYNSLRNSLQHKKNILISKSLKCLNDAQDRGLDGSKLQLASTENPQAKFSQMYTSEGLLHKLSEDNQIPFYLPVVSPLHFISELNGGSVVEFFHNSVAEVENEELRHLMWSSVVFYTNPDTELSSCVLLSTNALYFLLDNSLKQINSEDLDFWKTTNSERCAFHLSSCLVLKLSDLLSVNIGLFDQYFRITGPSPDHIVTCLTRDGYSTHAFIQHLMSALSLRARTPSPEPLEKDFYSEFGNKNTESSSSEEPPSAGKVGVHKCEGGRKLPRLKNPLDRERKDGKL